MSRLTKIVAGLAALAAFALGGAALATAGGGTTTAATPPAATQETAGTETNDTAGDQSPSYTGSITVPEQQDGASEQAEAAALKAKATVSETQAKDVALAAVPGTAGLVELDSENGSLVYSVEVKKADGTTVDVKVDAGNAKVLAQDAGEKDGAEAAEQPEAAGQPEAGEQPEPAQPGTATQP